MEAFFDCNMSHWSLFPLFAPFCQMSFIPSCQAAIISLNLDGFRRPALWLHTVSSNTSGRACIHKCLVMGPLILISSDDVYIRKPDGVAAGGKLLHKLTSSVKIQKLLCRQVSSKQQRSPPPPLSYTVNQIAAFIGAIWSIVHVCAIRRQADNFPHLNLSG